MIENARFVDAEQLTILADIDGVPCSIPAAPGNRHYDAIQAEAIIVAPYVAPPLTANDVRAECARRLCFIFGARDSDDLARKISNASREAIHLLRIKSVRPWTESEASRAAELEAADAMMEAMREVSNALEPNPPADFADDKHWIG